MINENSKNFLNTRFQFHCRIFIKLIEITQWNGKLVFKKPNKSNCVHSNETFHNSEIFFATPS